jgi:hypothetical protein
MARVRLQQGSLQHRRRQRLAQQVLPTRMPSTVATRTIWPCGMRRLRNSNSRVAKAHLARRQSFVHCDHAHVAETVD